VHYLHYLDLLPTMLALCTVLACTMYTFEDSHLHYSYYLIDTVCTVHNASREMENDLDMSLLYEEHDSD
jgi:hypothetical protein